MYACVYVYVCVCHAGNNNNNNKQSHTKLGSFWVIFFIFSSNFAILNWEIVVQ